MRHRLSLIVLVVFLTLEIACHRAVPPRTPQTPPLSLILTQVPVDRLREMNAPFPENMMPPLGSRIVRVSVGRSPTGLNASEVLTLGFAAAADPCVSFAGDSLLFAGKRSASDPWNIWRMALSGGEPVQVTHDLGDCREPFYMALGAITPPEFTDKVRWIGFTSTAAGTYDERGRGLATALYCQSLDSISGRGIVTWRITFNLSHDFSPSMLMLADGRVLFTSWRSGEGTGPDGIAGLLASDWSGTGLNPFFGEHDGALIKSMACEFPASRFVAFVESDGKTPLNGGSLARVWMRRPLRTYERISTEPGRFLTPCALPDGGMIVAYAPPYPQDRSYPKDTLGYGIYRYDPDTKSLGPCLFDDPDWADVDPQVIAPRREPQGQITIVVDSKTTGDVQCLNVYDSDQPRMRRIPKGQVKRVRVVEGLPGRERLTSLDSLTYSPHVRVIGEAPVEEDGSFYLCLPADTPILFQLLDEDGLTLMNMRSWVWLRRGDMRGCIGCHEDKELAPENRMTQALLRARSWRLTPPPEERRTVDFRREVAPILVRSCAGCHTVSHPTGLNLADGGSEAVYRRLLAGKTGEAIPYVRPGYARESALAWCITGRRLDGAPGSVRRMPPRGALTTDEVRTICEWIDLGAQFDNRQPVIGDAEGGR